MIQIVSSPSYAFVAMGLRRETFYPREVELIVDHYTEGDFLHIFEEGKAPAGVDVAAIKQREGAQP